MSDAPAATRLLRCPICGKSAAEEFRPFCSKRCADIDLGRWFSGGYAIAGRPDDDAQAAAPDSEDERPVGDPKRR